LLLSSRSADTKPQLEYSPTIGAAQGAAVGQIDEEELFYLQTGHQSDLAKPVDLGFAEEVIGKIAMINCSQPMQLSISCTRKPGLGLNGPERGSRREELILRHGGSGTQRSE
jgi:hypothetical protein